MKEFELLGGNWNNIDPNNRNKMFKYTQHAPNGLTLICDTPNARLNVRKSNFLSWVKAYSLRIAKTTNNVASDIVKAASLIALKSRRGAGNHVLMGKNVFAIWEKESGVTKIKACVSEKLFPDEAIVFYKSNMLPDTDVGFLYDEHDHELDLYFENSGISQSDNYFCYLNFKGKL